MLRSPHLPDAVPKVARAFLTGKQVGSDIGWTHRPLLPRRCSCQFPEPDLKTFRSKRLPSPGKVRDPAKLGDAIVND
jgi:hypothetical protein